MATSQAKIHNTQAFTSEYQCTWVISILTLQYDCSMSGLEFHLWTCLKVKAIFILQRALAFENLKDNGKFLSGHQGQYQGQWRPWSPDPACNSRLSICARASFGEPAKGANLWNTTLYVSCSKCFCYKRVSIKICFNR